MVANRASGEIGFAKRLVGPSFAFSALGVPSLWNSHGNPPKKQKQPFLRYMWRKGCHK
jgi:hypothetical protein